ncbi:MAG TPA: ketopantoate reductase family protein [Xanthobacteraceae bacterium]|jgi:2-dehydropantoate 2-reductase|nr:ketopantoate reductase family protein [Xanthobacteraceae bacterium]
MHVALTPVVVVGAGALGCLFGGMLARAGAPVTLIGRATHVSAIRRDGLVLESRAGTETIALSATEDVAAVGGAALVLLCVKSTDTVAAAGAMAPHLAADAFVLSLQNGVDNVERIRARMGVSAGAHVGNRVLPGLVYAGAEMAGPGHVRHTGDGDLVIGQLKAYARQDGSDRTLLAAIASLFTGAGVAVRISDAIEVDLWTKLTMNCAYNAISALGGARYGEMMTLPEIRATMQAATREVVAVAAAKGVPLADDIVDAVMKLADRIPVTMSSTAQDIRRGRRTEIDHLNGYVAREGDALGIAVPVNRTLHALVKLLERRLPAS